MILYKRSALQPRPMIIIFLAFNLAEADTKKWNEEEEEDVPSPHFSCMHMNTNIIMC